MTTPLIPFSPFPLLRAAGLAPTGAAERVRSIGADRCTPDASRSVGSDRCPPDAPGLIRRLDEADGRGLRDHWLRLDRSARHDRFSGGVSDAFLVTWAERTLAEPGVVLGHVCDGVVRGVAELKPCGPREAEGAFTVEAAHRRQGLGSALMRRLLLVARNRGIRTLQIRCLTHNRAMQALARAHGARLRLSDGEMLGTIDLRPATPLSLGQEIWLEGLAVPLMLLDRQRWGSPARA